MLTLWSFIIRECPARVEGDADLTAILFLVLITEKLNRARMREDKVVANTAV